MTESGPFAFHIALKNAAKQAIIDDHRNGVALFEVTPKKGAAYQEWSTRLPLYDMDGRKLEKCELYIAWRNAGLTEWVASLLVGGKAVIKIDVEREDKRQRPPIVDAKSGKLNSRMPIVIPAGTPHWREMDPATGALKDEHLTDTSAFPSGMKMHEAIAAFLSKHTNTSWPSGVKFYRMFAGKREELPPRSMFG